MTESGIRVIKHFDYKEDEFADPICILGMPGIADVGKFAIDSLIGQLDAKNFMDFIFSVSAYLNSLINGYFTNFSMFFYLPKDSIKNWS